MNFLSLRDDLQNWTLNSDDKLYKAIKELSDTVLEAQKLILNNIQTTRYQVNRGLVESGCSYNHYLRVSQTKFTENKIGQKRPAQKLENNAPKSEAKNKMDYFKQAIELGIKNLQIAEQKGGDNDLISMSDTSLSQSIYKDCRVPAFYGTKQFAMNSFLNLFTEGQLNALVPTQKFETNALVMNNQPQQILAPPPSLEESLNYNQYNYNQGLADLPPPPPPPPFNMVIPTSASISDLPPIPPFQPPNSSYNDNVNYSALPEIPPFTESMNSSVVRKVQIGQKIQIQSPSSPPPPPPVPVQRQKQPLSMQQQLALRLKHGKNYKKQIQVQDQPKSEPTKVIVVQQSISQPSHPNQLKPITQQRQSVQSSNIRNSMRNSYGGININEMINSTKSNAPINIKPNNQADQHQVQQEQADSFFGPSKSKARQTKRPINLENDIMKRQTFNQDILFKKKPVPEKKQVQKPKNTLFTDGGDQQSEQFVFKKKQDTKKKPNPTPQLEIAQKSQNKTKKKGLLDSDSDEDNSDLFKKKDGKQKQLPKIQKVQQPIAVIQKKPVNQTNPLLKPQQPKQQIQVKVTQVKKQMVPKLNPLFQPSNPIQQQQKQMQQPLLNIIESASKPSIDIRSSSQSSSSHASSYAMRVAAASGMGPLGMSMGMPMIPKGVIKPSEAKKAEEQYLKRKQQQEQQRKARQQQQKRLQEERRQQIERQTQIQRTKKINQEQQEKKRKQKILIVQEQPQKLPTIPKIQQKNENKIETKKRNALFDDEQDNDDIFKPKQKKINQTSQFIPSNKQKQQQQSLRRTQYSQPTQRQQVVIVKPSAQQNVNVDGQEDAGRTQSTRTQLATRRKKAKPNMNANKLFADSDEEIITNVPTTTVKQPVIKINSKSQQTIAADKISKQRQEQVKLKKQKQLQRMQLQKKQKEEEKKQDQRKQKQREEQQKRKAKQQQDSRKKQQQQRKNILEKKIKQQQQRRAKQQQQIRLQQARQQQARRIEQAKKIQQRKRQQQVYRAEQEAIRQKKQQEILRAQLIQQQRRKREEEQRQRRQERLRKEKQEQQRRKQEQQKKKQQQEQRRRQQQQKRREQQDRRKQQQQKKNQQAKVPFLPKLPTRSGPLGGPLGGPSPLPKINKPVQASSNPLSKKGGLFADDDEGEITFKATSKPSMNKALNTNTSGGQKKKTLFDDDDQDLNDNFLLGKKTATKPKQEISKSSKLFNDDQDDDKIVISKSKQAPQSNPVMEEVSRPKVQQPQLRQQPVVKEQPVKKKTLFDDNDDDDFMGSNSVKKAPPKAENPVLPAQSPQPTLSKPSLTQKTTATKKKGLFDDDDDDDDGFMVKKKPAAQQPTPNPISQPIKQPNNPQNQQKKTNLFDDSGSEDSYTARQQQKKREANKKIRPF